MKILFILFFACLPFSLFANEFNFEKDLTKYEACQKDVGMHTQSIAIAWFSNPAYSNEFIKLPWKLYYWVQEDINGRYANKSYSIYQYSCNTKKVQQILSPQIFSKLNKILDDNFVLMTLVSVKWNTVTVKFDRDGIGCNVEIEEDALKCDLWSIVAKVNMKTKTIEVSKLYRYKEDEFMTRFWY